MAKSDATEELGFNVLQSIRRISRRVSSHSRRMGRETGLSLPQVVTMRAIASQTADEVTVALIADAVHLSRPTVSTVVEKLVQAGLVDRVRSTRDRRRVHVSLTAAGRERLATVPKPFEDRFLARLAAVSKTERERILDVLQSVVRMMDAEDVDPT